MSRVSISGQGARIRYWLSLCLLTVAAWQGSQAGYIYAKAELAQWLIADAWQHSLTTGLKAKPWPWADTWPVARLRLPGRDDLFVLSGDRGNSLAFGPAHLSASSMPGMPGISVIGGHRDTHFSSLKSILQGDLIQLQNQSEQWLDYRVDDARIVDIRDTPLQLRSNDTGMSLLQLVTCYPFEALQPGGPLRYVVSAQALIP